MSRMTAIIVAIAREREQRLIREEVLCAVLNLNRETVGSLRGARVEAILIYFFLG